MSDVEFTRKGWLAREDAARWLSALAAALAKGGDVDMEVGGSRVRLTVPDHVRTEFEVEVDGDEIELELELKWSTAGRADAATATQAAAGAAPAPPRSAV
ncbi:amphi-Trp domain-containing protein [Pseudonocardia acidicola]|uniref:Amphi-Trp domain-containing protein n=1 Tax=Pseudonocardia acidicola TaxID=2724939 RepID=A0ABX1SEG9_9PSEU|nr:amphi-Trp domain-containing protein [Pseudonocardia acidicola]NMH99272.1 amphi-Trp domain-containing protein [Pseudonocardia acidicola]